MKTLKSDRLLAVAIILTLTVLLMTGTLAHAANFADYFPLDSSTRIYITTLGDPQDIGQHYVNRVIGTELINGTLTTKVGIFPYPEMNDGPDPYDSFVNITNDGTTLKWWGNQDVTVNPPLSFGTGNDGDVIGNPFCTDVTDRATQQTSNSCDAVSPVLIDIRDVTVFGVTYPNALIMFGLDPAYPVVDVNFGTNTLGFPATYSPNSNSPLPGAITYFDIYATGVGRIAGGDVAAETGEFNALTELKSVLANPLVGTWGYGLLRHRNDGTWSTQGGKTTYNSDGTGTDTFEYNNNGTLGSRTEDFTYSTQANQDGSITVISTFMDGTTKKRRFVLSDDGKMMIMDGTDRADRQVFKIAIRLDTSRTFTNADFCVDYYTPAYAHDAGGTNYYYNASSGIVTPDGSGNCNGDFTENHDGTVWTGSNVCTYSVNSDGAIIFGGAEGYLSGNARLGIASTTGSINNWGTGFFMKKQDRNYSTADLAGTWALIEIGDDNGNSFYSGFGSTTCDSNGNCTMSHKLQRDGNITHESLDTIVSVASDGSFGNSLGDVAPSYAGAIGNYGNTIMGNLSFESISLNHRGTVVGVRCSNCADLPTGQTWFEEDDPVIIYSGTWGALRHCTSCSGGGLTYSNETGARAEFSFNGTGIRWIVTKAKMMGKAKVYLDGVYTGLVDLFASTPKFQQVIEAHGLSPGAHTLAIEVAGQKHPVSAGYYINIDAFEVIP